MKKILAIAIATAFAAPAFAATANVDIYGNMHLSMDYLDNGTAHGNNISSNASSLGFKGTEDLGGGLNAIWQIESNLNADSASTFGAARDTFVGLKGGFGTVRLGFFNTPTKQLSRKLDLFNNRIGDTRNFLRSNASIGSGGANGARNAWEERFTNSVRYDTPSFSGFNASVHYSTNADTASATTSNQTDAYSLGANYANGPLFVGATYQVNNLYPYSVTNTTAEEKNWRLGAGFNVGDLKLVALYSKSIDQRGTSGADRDVWGVGAGYKLGNGEIKAQFYKASDEDNTAAATGAKMFAVGYDYNLSKRTLAYVAYAETRNDAGAAFSMSGGGGHGDNAGVAGLGQDPSGFSLGMIHKF